MDVTIMEKDKIKEIHEAWNNGIVQLSTLRSEMREDLEMCYGDQWFFADRKKNTPMLSINFIKGRVRRRSGFIRQNMPEPRVLSLSTYGDEFCDIMQQALKYIYSEKENYINRMAAIDTALACGLGWLHVYLDYDDDIINGDVKLINVSPFDIVFDPYINTPDFKDCRYIIHRTYLSKDEIKQMYPKFSKDIDLISDEEESEYEHETGRTYKTTKNMVNMFDYWYIDYIKEQWYVNMNTGEYGVFSDDLLPMEGDIKIVEKKVPRAYMRRVVGNIILYDGESPYEKTTLPYIPITCYNVPIHPQWEYRLQGITRGLKDLQMEKNKRRSSIMKNVLNKFLRGYLKLRDESADLEGYLNGDVEILEVDDLNSIREIDPPKLPESLIFLEKEIDNDLNIVDANLQMLDSNTSSYQAIGALQLKLREGLIADQEIYDNVNYAMTRVSSYIVNMINQNWTTEKFKKIVGYNMPYVEEHKQLENQAEEITKAIDMAQDEEQQKQLIQQGTSLMQQVEFLQSRIAEAWNNFDKQRRDIKYIVKFGEGVEETPTYKLSHLNTFTMLKHQGQDIPDEIYIEFLDIPKRIKDKWMDIIRSRSQMQMQLEQARQQFELQKEEIKAQVKLVLQDMINEGKIELEKLRQKDVYEYDIVKRVEDADTKNN